MFYLAEFFKVIKVNKILASVLFVSLFSIYTISLFQYEIEKELSLNGKIKNTPYFNALLRENIDINTVRRRMIMLPGVSSVELNQNSSIEKEVSALKEVFGGDLIENLSTTKYQRLRVELDKGIKAKSFNLIKEYLSRLVGKDAVTIGQMKRPKDIQLKNDDVLFQFLKWADTYALILFSILWIISSVLILVPMFKRAYIIEKFQRKNHVLYKLMGTGFFSYALLIVCIGFLFKFELSEFGIMLSIFLFMITLLIGAFLSKTKKMVHVF